MESGKFGKTVERNPKGGSGFVQIWDGDLPTEEKVLATNKFATVADNKWVAVGKSGGKWFLAAAEV